MESDNSAADLEIAFSSPPISNSIFVTLPRDPTRRWFSVLVCFLNYGFGRSPQVGGGGSVVARFTGRSFNKRRTSSTAFSSCGSRPAITSFGQFSTSISGPTPSFSTAHFPSRVKKPPRGAIIDPPSMKGGVSAVCTSPPHVRLPTNRPILRRLNIYGIKSPPEPAISLTIITFGPQIPAEGLVNG